MIEIQNHQTQPGLRTCGCSICGSTVRVNPLKSDDTDVICKKCRCRRCSIPMSAKPCRRCGVAHGTPSIRPGLCEQCFDKAAAGHESVESDEETESHVWSAIA